jgi:hypothetical protein
MIETRIYFIVRKCMKPSRPGKESGKLSGINMVEPQNPEKGDQP